VETLREIVEDDYFSAVEVGPVGDDQERERARELLVQSSAGERRFLASWRLGERKGTQPRPCPARAGKGAKARRGRTGSSIAVAFGAQGILLSRGLDLAAGDESERDEAVQAVCEGIAEAAALGASACGILAGKDPGDRFKRDAAKARLVESIERLCRYAADKGDMVIELEQFGGYEPRRASRMVSPGPGRETRRGPSRHKSMRVHRQARYPRHRLGLWGNSLIGPTEEAVEIAQEVRRHHTNFGLLIDLSHLPLLNEKPREAINAAGEFLSHAHIGNCVKRHPRHPAYGDQHPVFGIPEGENDVPEIKDFLAGFMDVAFLERGGERILSFEVKPFGNQTTQQVIPVCKEKLDEAWRLL